MLSSRTIRLCVIAVITTLILAAAYMSVAMPTARAALSPKDVPAAGSAFAATGAPGTDVPGQAAAAESDDEDDKLCTSKEPIVFDEVLLSARDYNAKCIEVRRQGVKLSYRRRDGMYYVFATDDNRKSKLMEEMGFPPSPKPKGGSHLPPPSVGEASAGPSLSKPTGAKLLAPLLACPGAGNSSLWFEHAACGGSAITCSECASADLRNVLDGWNDRISSIQAWTNGMNCIYENIDYGGAELCIIWAQWDDLTDGGGIWNDVASSLQSVAYAR